VLWCSGAIRSAGETVMLGGIVHDSGGFADIRPRAGERERKERKELKKKRERE
jgi:hypothetical protein